MRGGTKAFQLYLSQKVQLERLISLFNDGNEAAAFTVTQKLVKEGNPAAQYYYAHYVERGIGVKKDRDRAIRILNQAFPRLRAIGLRGDAVAQYVLALMCRGGNGTERSLIESSKWLKKSAGQGYAPAQLGMGVLYSSGKGVPLDLAEAAKWYRMAAEQGNNVAQYNLAALYAQGKGVKKDEVEAAKWTRMSAEQGDADAQYQLSGMCMKGTGMKQDRAEGIKWLRKAAQQGHERAGQVLNIVEQDK
jgi:TPR repeat protein